MVTVLVYMSFAIVLLDGFPYLILIHTGLPPQSPGGDVRVRWFWRPKLLAAWRWSRWHKKSTVGDDKRNDHQ